MRHLHFALGEMLGFVLAGWTRNKKAEARSGLYL